MMNRLIIRILRLRTEYITENLGFGICGWVVGILVEYPCESFECFAVYDLDKRIIRAVAPLSDILRIAHQLISVFPDYFNRLEVNKGLIKYSPIVRFRSARLNVVKQQRQEKNTPGYINIEL
jgi:hypothetical protein